MQLLMIMDYLGLDQLIVGFGFVIMLKVLVVFIGLLFVGLLFLVFMIVSKIKVNKKLMLYVFIIDKYNL